MGRVCAVVTRPLFLFVAINFLGANVSEGLAVVFLAIALALVGTAADSHRRFYLRHFDPEPSFDGVSFYIYATSLVLLGGLGGVVVFAFVLYFTGSYSLSVISVGYFVSEKLADELLRLKLFERDFGTWGRFSISRSLLQLAGLVALAAVTGGETPTWLLVFVLALGNLAVFVPQLPSSLRRCLRVIRLDMAVWLSVRAVRALLGNWILWAIALLGSGVGYLDRIGALVLDKAILPLFMLIVMCFSIVQMAVDFYYVSHHRRDFLEQRISVLDAVSSRKFVVSLSAGLVLACVSSFVVLQLSHNGADLPLGYVLAIAALQVSFAMVSIPQQILYWKHYLVHIFRIEIAFWALFAVSVIAGWWLSLQLAGVLALVTACALARLAIYIGVAVRVAPSIHNE